MRGWATRWDRIAAVLFTATLAGCDSDTIAPPPPGKARPAGVSGGSIPTRAKEIVLVLPAAENNDLMIYDLAARNESGLLKVFFRALKPSPGDPPTKQAELIKAAAAEGASALVVVPDATKETAEALAALDAKKTPVVLLVRTPAGGAPASATLVDYEPSEVSARKLVDAIVADGKLAGAKPGAPVILVTLKDPDENSAGRDAALAEALKAAGLPVAATVPATADSNALQAAIQAALKAHPEAFAVVCDDEPALLSANGIRREMKDRKFLVTGYSAGRGNLQTILVGPVSAVAERSVENLARRAVRVALERAQGKETPAKVLVALETRKGNVTAESLQPPSSEPPGLNAKRPGLPQTAPPTGTIPEAKKPE
jgi:ABC-type sugar transport system substrate-binding protein